MREVLVFKILGSVPDECSLVYKFNFADQFDTLKGEGGLNEQSIIMNSVAGGLIITARNKTESGEMVLFNTTQFAT
jgi:hypothetical protein